jgi:hypothetical protein
MSATLNDVLLIPYGVAEWSPEGLTLEGFSARTLRLRTAFPCAAINRAAREPLRFNNSRYEAGFAATAQSGAADDATLVKDYLKGLCRPWDNVARQFLDAYFGFASDLIEAHRDVLAARLESFAGLYKPTDWLFSAPKPLPRAHLHAPQESSAGTTTGVSTADFVRVDFAFWLGNRLIAAQSSQSALTPKKAKEQTDRLRIAGIEAVTFAPAELAGAKAGDLFTRLLGSSLAFWEDQPLPAGPFRASLIED